MKNVKFLMMLMFVSLIIGNGCRKDEEILTKSSIISSLRSNSGSLPQETQNWFSNYLISKMNYDQKQAFLQYFNFRWDKIQIWNDSTLVVPAQHSSQDFVAGYTRLFISYINSYQDSSIVFLYTVIPDSLDMTKTPDEIANSFTGNIGVFDLTDGLKEVMTYSDGEYFGHWNNLNVLQSRSSFWWEHFKNPFIHKDGVWGTTASEQGSSGFLPVIPCNAPCPRGFSNDRCRHPRDCNNNNSQENGNFIFINVNSVNFIRPSVFLHNIGSKRKNIDGISIGGSGGSGNSGIGNQNIKNPIDREGISEAMKSLLKIIICEDLSRFNSSYTCDELIEIVDPSCANATNLIDCVNDAIEAHELNKTQCLQAFANFVKDHPFITKDMIIEIRENFNINAIKDCRNQVDYNKELSFQIIESCLNSASQAFLQFLEQNHFFDPCSGNEIDITDNLLKMCVKGQSYTIENFEASLSEDEKSVFQIRQQDFATCPKLSCVLNNVITKTISSNLTSSFCNQFGNPNQKPFVAFGAQNFSQNPSLNPNALAVTSVKTTSIGRVDHIVSFNTNNCITNSDPLDIFETIQHEFVHVEIHEKLVKNYGWDGNTTTKQAAFMAMMAAEYPGNPSVTEHQLMLTVYLNDFKNGMMAANGGVGLPPIPPSTTPNPDIYLGLILNGYSDELAFIQSHLGISATQINSMKNQYNAWINTQVNNIFINQSPNGVFGYCP